METVVDITPMALPQIPVCVRTATIGDLPFIDRLQKLHANQVGWMPTKQLEEKIGKGQVIVAEATGSTECQVRSTEWKSSTECGDANPRDSSSLRTPYSALSTLGYCIGQDQYFKRDDVGIIYQMNVVPGHQRALIGATLLAAMFERAAYGCRLYCCWCAQDIAANKFWEAMGFVPLAFRAGSAKKGRVHIFWQRRIRAGDGTTPYWFPSQTTSGSIREDRLVLPIPPGLHWSDEMPRVLPGAEKSAEYGVRSTEKKTGERKALPGRKSSTPYSALRTQHCSTQGSFGGSKLFFAPKPVAKAGKTDRPKRKLVKNDPKLVAAARELRDRWLEQLNAREGLPAPAAKYAVAKRADAPRARRATDVTPPPLLAA